MGITCPRCRHENPEDALYCSKCAGPLGSAEGISLTKTLITSRDSLQKGSTFAGRYTILEELGRGGMGVVYKAEDTKLRRTVALKFLPSELTHIPEVGERFMHEAQAAAALDHPNICTVYEFDQADKTSFISMAYIEGQSLRKKIESGPLELDEALRIALLIAEGLQHAHKKGVVHKDIKSANIMVTEDDQAKIMDFGLARVTGGTLVTQEGMTMGTVTYMSPEQARGEKVVNKALEKDPGRIFWS
jgi:serine/threonine protein kinase